MSRHQAFAGIVLAGFVSLVSSSVANSATYQIDPTHTHVGFKVKHMMVSWVRGSFSDVSGVVEFDPARPEATKVNATVKVLSVDTGMADRDDHLKKADFFDVTQFPEMKFVSKSVSNISAEGFDVLGDLTIRGVTKPASFRFTTPSEEMKDPWGNYKRGFTASTKVNRKDFGMSFNSVLETGGAMVGDEVFVEVEVEIARK